MKYKETTCPKCGVSHATEDYLFDHTDVDGYETGDVDWYACPTCNQLFNDLEC